MRRRAYPYRRRIYRRAPYRKYLGRRTSLNRPMNVAVRGLQRNRMEWKSVDVNGNIDADTTGGVALLNGIARGDDISERIGRKVMIKSIQLSIKNNVIGGTGVDQCHRVMLVLDNQTNAAALTIAQVLSSSGTMYYRNLENRARFRILFDKFFTMNATGESGSMVNYKYYRKVDIPVTFNNGDAGTVADIVTGSLYILVVGDAAPGVTAGKCYYYSRIRYEDA